MTRGAAANAILDAGRSKKCSPPFPLCPVPSTRSLSPLARSLPSIPSSLSLFRALFLSLPCDSFGEGGGPSPSLSFFLLGPAPSFSSVLARFFLGTLPSPPSRRCSPRGFPLSSLLMPRDRQMMIKKAPVRVRTTPRRPIPPPASLLVLHHLLLLFLLLLLLHPLLHLRQFFFLFSSLDSLRCTCPLPLLPDGRELSLSLFFFRRLISARSFSLSSSVHPPSYLPPKLFSPLRGPSLSCGYTFVACIIVRGECLRVACPLFVTDDFAEGCYQRDHYQATMADRRW